MRITVNGTAASGGSVTLPRSGPWFADLRLPSGAVAQGDEVEIALGPRTLEGTVVRAITYGGETRAEILAGGGTWGLLVARRGYYSPSGVKLSTVLADIARDCGESIRGDERRLGEQWARAAGPASRALWELSPGWWVQDDGQGVLAPRAGGAAPRCTVLEVDGSGLVATVRSESAHLLDPGQTLTIRGQAQTIDAVEHQIRSGGVDSVLTLALPSAEESRLGTAIRAIVERYSRARWAGTYRYRVVAVSGDTMDLDPVSAALELPQLSHVALRLPAGVRGVPQVGATVVVGFADLDPGQPYVVACESAGGDWEAGGTLEIDAPAIDMGASVGTLDIGPPNYPGHVVRYGDPVVVGTAAGAIAPGPLPTISVVRA